MKNYILTPEDFLNRKERQQILQKPYKGLFRGWLKKRKSPPDGNNKFY